MANVNKRPTEDQTDCRFKEMAEFVNTRVFELVTKTMKDDQHMIKHEDLLSANRMKKYFGLWDYLRGLQLRPVLDYAIQHKYDVEYEVAVTVAKETIADVIKRYGLRTNSVSQQMRELEIAFSQTEYVGNASYKFKEYLESCWKMHCKDPKTFKDSYVALVQSSGFGKSRMLFEIARMALEASSKMKVLYVCATEELIGYPKATESLQKWLFPYSCTSNSIATRLKVIFQYAVDNWETVQDEWLQLFTMYNGDVTSAMKHYDSKMLLEKKSSTSNSSSGKVVIVVIDEARSLLSEGQDGLNRFHMLRQALQSTIATDGGVFGVLVNANIETSVADPSSRLNGSVESASFPPFVLTDTMDMYWQKYCGEKAVRVEKMRGSDERVIDMRDQAVKAADDQMSAYKDAVTGSKQDAWKALVRMGRPMWYSIFNVSPNRNSVVDLAAMKLLIGPYPNYTAYNMNGIASLLCRVGLRPYSTTSYASRAVAYFMATLEGYTSSYTSDPVLALGARKVWRERTNAFAEFILPQLERFMMNEVLDNGRIDMVVARIVLLLCMDECVVSGTYPGQFISVHAFLKAFGVEEMPVFTPKMCAISGDTKDAFRTWLSKWDSWQMGFSHFVQLKIEPTEETLWYLLGRRAAGIFPRNQKGADLFIPIFWKKTDGEAAFESEMKTEDVVDAKVSLILIQVKNRPLHESGFPKSVTTKLRPSFVFRGKLKNPKVSANNLSTEVPSKGSKEESVECPSIKKPVEDPQINKLIENPLSKKSIRDVICIYMNVQKEDSKYHRFIYAFEDGNTSNGSNGAKLVDTSETKGSESKTHGSKPKDGDSKVKSVATASGSNDSQTKAASELMFTFCYRSVHCNTYKFLDAKVAGRLASLVENLWDPMALVEGDLKHRQWAEKGLTTDSDKAILSRAMGDDELRMIACKGLAEPPGRHKPVEPASVKGQDGKMFKLQSSNRKRNRGDKRGDLRKHQRRA